MFSSEGFKLLSLAALKSNLKHEQLKLAYVNYRTLSMWIQSMPFILFGKSLSTGPSMRPFLMRLAEHTLNVGRQYCHFSIDLGSEIVMQVSEMSCTSI